MEKQFNINESGSISAEYSANSQHELLFHIAKKEVENLEAERNHLMNMLPFCLFPEDVVDLREKIEEIDADIITIRRNIQMFQKFMEIAS